MPSARAISLSETYGLPPIIRTSAGVVRPLIWSRAPPCAMLRLPGASSARVTIGTARIASVFIAILSFHARWYRAACQCSVLHYRSESIRIHGKDAWPLIVQDQDGSILRRGSDRTLTDRRWK